jgi:hypothetical protein
MPPIPARFRAPGDPDFQTCIKLVRKVSYQAQNFEYGTKDDNTSIGHIKQRMKNNNWWATWIPPSGPVDVCAFFQRSVLKNQDYVMCVGFDDSYLSTTDPDPQKFITRAAGNGSGDGFLADFIYQLTPNHYVYVVDMPLSTPDAVSYNTRLNNLFTYAQTHPTALWSFSPPDPTNNDTNQDDIFLASGNPDPTAGTGLNFWKLTITPPPPSP